MLVESRNTKKLAALLLDNHCKNPVLSLGIRSITVKYLLGDNRVFLNLEHSNKKLLIRFQISATPVIVISHVVVLNLISWHDNVPKKSKQMLLIVYNETTRNTREATNNQYQTKYYQIWRFSNKMDIKNLSCDNITYKQGKQLTHSNSIGKVPSADRPQKCHHTKQKDQFYSIWPTDRAKEALDVK